VYNPEETPLSAAAKSRAARMGPTVCELEGPMPILKISKMLVFTEPVLQKHITNATRALAAAWRRKGADTSRTAPTGFRGPRAFWNGLIWAPFSR